MLYLALMMVTLPCGTCPPSVIPDYPVVLTGLNVRQLPPPYLVPSNPVILIPGWPQPYWPGGQPFEPWEPVRKS